MKTDIIIMAAQIATASAAWRITMLCSDCGALYERTEFATPEDDHGVCGCEFGENTRPAVVKIVRVGNAWALTVDAPGIVIGTVRSHWFRAALDLVIFRVFRRFPAWAEYLYN